MTMPRPIPTKALLWLPLFSLLGGFLADGVVLGAPEKQEKISLKTLVMPLMGRRGVDQDLAAAMTAVVETTLSADAKRTVYSKRDLATVLDLEAQKSMVGCDSSSCMTELAAAMDVDSIVTGSMDKLGDTYLVSLVETDARTVKNVARVQGSCPAQETKLVSSVTALVNELLTKSGKKIVPHGTVVIQTVPTGRTVTVGTKDLGPTPVNTDLPVGTYRVTVGSESGEELPAQFDLAVERRKTTTAEIKLSEPPELTPAEQEAYDSALFMHPVLMWTKMLVGIPLCLCGGCAAGIYTNATIMTTKADYSTIEKDPQKAEEMKTNAMVSSGVLAATGAVAALLGVGGLGWAVIDIFNPPEQPHAENLQHHVVVTLPSGQVKKQSLKAVRGDEEKGSEGAAY